MFHFARAQVTSLQLQHAHVANLWIQCMDTMSVLAVAAAVSSNADSCSTQLSVSVQMLLALLSVSTWL